MAFSMKRIICALVLAGASTALPAFAVEESEVLAQLETLRGVQPLTGDEALKQRNAKLDAVWRFLRENKAQALPGVRRELRAELYGETPHLDEKSRAYLESILPDVRAVTFERLAESLGALDGEGPMLNDEALSRRLEAYARTGECGA